MFLVFLFFNKLHWWIMYKTNICINKIQSVCFNVRGLRIQHDFGHLNPLKPNTTEHHSRSHKSRLPSKIPLLTINHKTFLMVLQMAEASCLERSKDVYFFPMWLSKRDKWLPLAFVLSCVSLWQLNVFWRAFHLRCFHKSFHKISMQLAFLATHPSHP